MPEEESEREKATHCSFALRLDRLGFNCFVSYSFEVLGACFSQLGHLNMIVYVPSPKYAVLTSKTRFRKGLATTCVACEGL